MLNIFFLFRTRSLGPVLELSQLHLATNTETETKTQHTYISINLPEFAGDYVCVFCLCVSVCVRGEQAAAEILFFRPFLCVFCCFFGQVEQSRCNFLFYVLKLN